MTTRRGRRGQVAAVLCAILAGPGCGGEHQRSPPRATTQGTASVTAETPAPPPPPPVAEAPPVAEPPPAATPSASAAPRRPPIIRMSIPYGAQRKQQMAAYSQRHYGSASYRLTDPRVIVEHFTVTDSVEATYDIFASNARDPELQEVPGVCSHFAIGATGRIYQLVALSIRCRHTVGLNDRAFGIEHVGRSDRQVLGNRRQLAASLRLTAWLRCRHHIAVRNVIGHNESLSSPYHHEIVGRLKTQTHEDFARASMRVYRSKLRTRACA